MIILLLNGRGEWSGIVASKIKLKPYLLKNTLNQDQVLLLPTNAWFNLIKEIPSK